MMLLSSDDKIKYWDGSIPCYDCEERRKLIEEGIITVVEND